MSTATSPESRSPESSSMIDRVAQILEAFDGPRSLTLAQVVARTGLPRSSTHRILDQLVKVRWLSREDRNYHLGLGMLELGTLAGHQHELRRAATVALHELAHDTGLVVHLAVLDGTDIVYLDKIGGRFGVRVPSRVGGRAPAHCTGAGKAMLAFADDTVIKTLTTGPMPTPTAASIGTERALRAELTRVRDRGVAFDREESARGLACVAVPVGIPGSPGAAVSVCGPVGRMNVEQLIAPVRATAHAVWSAFVAGRPGPPSSLGARSAGAWTAVGA